MQNALLGGLAISAWTEPRFTRDVDLAVAVRTDSEAAVRVARVGHLVALKLLARDPGTRPQDALDLNALRALLDSDETTRAHEACELIMQRGYARGRDLPALLRTYLSE